MSASQPWPHSSWPLSEGSLLSWSGVEARGRRPRLMLATIGIVVGACAIGAIVLQNVHVTRLTADSVRYLVTADALETSGSLDGVNAWDLRMRHLGAPLLHTGRRHHRAGVSGFDHPSAGCLRSRNGRLGRLGRVRDVGDADAMAVAAAGATAALLVSTNRWLYHAFYVNGHMAIGYSCGRRRRHVGGGADVARGCC